MESVCQPCKRNGFSYIFYEDKLQFQAARQSCLDKGGSLASNLNAETYQMFHRCCPGGNRYWIGLFNEGECRDDQFQWVTGEGLCTSAEPLNVNNQPNNMNCQAIRIGLRTNDHGMSLPDAIDTDCTSSSRYICQFQIPTTKVVPSESRSVSTATSTITMRSEEATYFLPLSTTSSFKIDGGLIAGLAIGGAVAFLLTLIMLIFCRAKRKLLNKLNTRSNGNVVLPAATVTTERRKDTKHAEGIRAASSVGATQQQPSTSREAGPAEEHYAPPNIQLDDIFPYAISRTTDASEYENDRRVTIESNLDGYETFGSKVTYLTLDNSNGESSCHYNNVLHLTANEKREDDNKTVYLKPFN